MDYESREVKWYWLILFILYSCAVVYILFSGNPYLYSHLELRSELIAADATQLMTIPAKPSEEPKPGNPTYQSRYAFERTGVDPLSTPRHKNFEEFEKFPVETGLDKFQPQNISGDASGFYLTGNSEWMVAVGLDGRVRWKYRFLQPMAERGLLPPLLDEGHVYVIHPKGEIVAFDKTAGKIHWVLPVKAEIIANPFLWHGYLVLPSKGKQGIDLIMVNRNNGARREVTPRLDLKPGFQLARDGDDLIATIDNKVISINTEDWKPEWSQTLTDPVRGPAVVADGQVYVATLGAKLLRLDARKKGKIEWEIDLEKPALSSPSYLPVVNRLSFLDNGGGLVTVDAKTGKQLWRYAVDNRNPLEETWSGRLRGAHIEEFGMDWLHKGWTVWTPCGDRRFCIFTPNKGQMISKVALSGEILGLPLQIDKRLVFFTQSKPGQFVVSHAVEEPEIKRLRKEAAAAAEVK